MKEFDQGFSEVVQNHLKSEISLVSLVEYILARIDDGLPSEDFRLTLDVNCIP